MDLGKLVKELMDNYEEYDCISKIDTTPQVNKETVIKTLDALEDLLFPGFFGRKELRSDVLAYYVGDRLQMIHHDLQSQIVLAMAYSDDYKDYAPIRKEGVATKITTLFLQKLPEIRTALAKDAEAIFDGDPAAYSIAEIVYSYPGFYAIMVNRIAHELYNLKVPMIPRMLSEHAHSLTGIDIHPGATLGEYLMIDHGTGIVIGETTIIGNNVKIYQGVTLGALSTKGGQALKEVKRHPTIEDNVTIYSNASILGGQTVIGKGSTIGGNTFVTESVPSHSVVLNKYLTE